MDCDKFIKRSINWVFMIIMFTAPLIAETVLIVNYPTERQVIIAVWSTGICILVFIASILFIADAHRAMREPDEKIGAQQCKMLWCGWLPQYGSSWRGFLPTWIVIPAYACNQIAIWIHYSDLHWGVTLVGHLPVVLYAIGCGIGYIYAVSNGPYTPAVIVT